MGCCDNEKGCQNQHKKKLKATVVCHQHDGVGRFSDLLLAMIACLLSLK